MLCRKCGLSFWQAVKRGWMEKRKCDDGGPHRFKRSFTADKATRRVDWWGLSRQLGLLAGIMCSMFGVVILLQAVGFDAESVIIGILSWILLVWVVGAVFGLEITVEKVRFRRNRSVEAGHE